MPGMYSSASDTIHMDAKVEILEKKTLQHKTRIVIYIRNIYIYMANQPTPQLKAFDEITIASRNNQKSVYIQGL